MVSRKNPFFIPIIIVLSGGFLRWLSLITLQELHIDEAITYSLSRFSFPDVFCRLSVPVHVFGTSIHFHPPFSYLLLRGWTNMGNSEAFLRLFPLLFGTASIAVFYLFLRGCLGRTVAIIGASFLATSAFQIFYSTDFRYYTLFEFLSIISFYSYIKIFSSQGSNFVSFLYILSTALCMYTSYYGLFLPLIHNVGYLFFIRRIPISEWLKLQIPVGLIYWPWLGTCIDYFFAGAQSQPQSWREWLQSTAWILDQILVFDPPASISPLSFPLFLATMFTGIAFLYKRNWKLAVISTIYILIPLLAHRFLPTVHLVDRAFIFMAPALLIGVSSGICSGLRSRLNIVRVISIFLFVFLMLTSMLFSLGRIPRSLGLLMSGRGTGQPGPGDFEQLILDLDESLTNSEVVFLDRGKLYPLFEKYDPKHRKIIQIIPEKQILPPGLEKADYLTEALELYSNRYDIPPFISIHFDKDVQEEGLPLPRYKSATFSKKIHGVYSLEFFHANRASDQSDSNHTDLRFQEINTGAKRLFYVDMQDRDSFVFWAACEGDPEKARLYIFAKARPVQPFYDQIHIHVNGRKTETLWIGSDFYFLYPVTLNLNGGENRISIVRELQSYIFLSMLRRPFDLLFKDSPATMRKEMKKQKAR